jgi:hypothetical protein
MALLGAPTLADLAGRARLLPSWSSSASM